MLVLFYSILTLFLPIIVIILVIYLFEGHSVSSFYCRVTPSLKKVVYLLKDVKFGDF